MEEFVQSLLDGTLRVFDEDYRERTAIFKLLSFEASIDDFVEVLLQLRAAGGNADHVDRQSISVLMLSTNDTLGVALVRVGASAFMLRITSRSELWRLPR